MSTAFSFSPPPTSKPALAPGEIHLWQASLNCPCRKVRQLEKLLSADEASKAHRHRFPEDRDRSILGRSLLRLLLGRYLEMPPAEIRLVDGATGKPALETGSRLPLRFSLSHTKEMVVYALTLEHDVGVDVEAVRPVAEAEDILRRFFPSADLAAWKQAGPDVRDRLFLELWTRREACLKGTGEGLAGLEARSRHVLPPPGWEVITFPLEPASIASLACKGEIGELAAWEIPAHWTAERIA